ncbi:MAG TPA: GntR family transcriptional regulator [Gammaproteobacteria bacterium]|nr:GntR family transcriptional regulator [Gammaproteobacteria bacterium]
MRAASRKVERTQPIRKTKSGVVTEQIIVAIQDREHGLGDNLISERALAEELDVSRIAIREAISALQLSGIVTGFFGRGTFVDSMAPNGAKPGTVDALESTATFKISRRLDRLLNQQQPAERPAPGPTRARPSSKMLFSG